tara:strand:- start:16416 stop:16595 length:180 start_codon:yes stop_codon:yes gene_type:complete
VGDWDINDEKGKFIYERCDDIITRRPFMSDDPCEKIVIEKNGVTVPEGEREPFYRWCKK